MNRGLYPFQNLLSGIGVEDLELDGHPGTRLSAIQARHAEADQTCAYIEVGSDTEPDRPTSAHRSEIYTGNWKVHDIGVIKLAATVIFCVVITACLGKFVLCTLLG
jgi:hypothetical protein